MVESILSDQSSLFFILESYAEDDDTVKFLEAVQSSGQGEAITKVKELSQYRFQLLHIAYHRFRARVRNLELRDQTVMTFCRLRKHKKVKTFKILHI